MNNFVRVAALLLATVMLSGCLANMNSIYREFDVNRGQSVSIDAKQRVVLVTKNGVCAEPSPDALSVIGASLAASGATPQQISVQLAAAMSETGSNIGVRSQTIQLLRDAMYRLCEGHIGGAIRGPAFIKLQRVYQNAMMGLLAIEQLTGAVAPRARIINASAKADSGTSLLEAQKSLEIARESLDKLEKSLKKANDDLAKEQGALREKNKESETLKTASESDSSKTAEAAAAASKATQQKEMTDKTQKIVDDLQKQVEDAKKNLKAAEEFRDRSRGVKSKTGGKGQFLGNTGSTSSTISKEAAKELGAAVVAIVKEIVNASYAEETCLEIELKNLELQAAAPALAPAPVAALGAVKYFDKFGNAREFCEKILNLKARQAFRETAEKPNSLPGQNADFEALRQIELENEKMRQQLRKIELERELKRQKELKATEDIKLGP